MVGAVRADRAVLSQAGQWPPAGGGGTHVAPLFSAAMVQPVGSGGGGGALRFAGDAAFCRHRSRTRTSAGRDHGVPLPPSARGARSGPPTVRRGAAPPAGHGTESPARHALEPSGDRTRRRSDGPYQVRDRHFRPLAPRDVWRTRPTFGRRVRGPRSRPDTEPRTREYGRIVV